LWGTDTNEPRMSLARGQRGDMSLRSVPTATASVNASLDGGMAKLKVAAHPDLPKDGPPEIFVSYAWGDDKTLEGRQRGEVVERLRQKLGEWGYQVVRDTHVMRAGDLISNFMKRIGRADHVLVILSDKYLHSPYCMSELHYIYERSLGEKGEFLHRIIPLALEDAKIDGWRDRAAHAKYWKREYQDMEANTQDLGVEDFRRYRMVQRWHSDIGDILVFIADKLSPRGFDAIVDDDFRAVRAMLPPL
jgi:internalin A